MKALLFIFFAIIWLFTGLGCGRLADTGELLSQPESLSTYQASTIGNSTLSVKPIILEQLNFGGVSKSSAQVVTVSFSKTQTQGNLNIVVIGWNDASSAV